LCGDEEAAKYVLPEEDSKKTILYLDDEKSILKELKKAKEDRGAKGIAIFVPDEGSSLPVELERQCSLKLRILNPNSFRKDDDDVSVVEEEWKEHQAGLPGSLSTTVVLDKLRNLIHDHFSV
jgi:hypothetical protein